MTTNINLLGEMVQRNSLAQNLVHNDRKAKKKNQDTNDEVQYKKNK